MNYNIYENGEHINTIVASPAFVEQYCAENGYTYELREDEQQEEYYTVEEALRALIGG